ncbi:translation initiation factor Sui1 [Escherichia coli]|nr:translation initiation factor Sui1 [Escherichia coli]
MSQKRPLYALKATVWCVFSVRPVDVKVRGVCLITGIDLDDAELTKLAAELKKKCGCGGAVKDGIIEIQGDKCDLLKSLLEAKGMKVKLAGG